MTKGGLLLMMAVLASLFFAFVLHPAAVAEEKLRIFVSPEYLPWYTRLFDCLDQAIGPWLPYINTIATATIAYVVFTRWRADTKIKELEKEIKELEWYKKTWESELIQIAGLSKKKASK